MTDEEKIIGRILDVIPPHSFELTTFLTLFRVRLSDRVETACVTCGSAPELLLNKAFIETHCRTNEHLYMLIMHELYHVILGHTTLFPRATPVQNIVFDAVINALLCSLFPEPEYTSFFTDYYPSDEMPYALLRPKGEGTPCEAEYALGLLYHGEDSGTYLDVYEALMASGYIQACAVRLETTDEKPVLLGNHGEEKEIYGSEMKALIHEIISKWPSPDRPLQGCDIGASARERRYDGNDDVPSVLRCGIRKLMRYAALPGAKEVHCSARQARFIETETFMPDWRDRAHEARASVLGDALVYRTYMNITRPSRFSHKRTFVYFDVSGSMTDEVPRVAKALWTYDRRGLCDVHVFSTQVYSASVHDLMNKKLISTGGTDIDCVLQHVMDIPNKSRPNAVVIITDGFTGYPNPTLAARFRETKIRLYVGLVKSNSPYDSKKDLASLAKQFIQLY